MENKPVLIFTVFMVTAVILIAGYLILSNPFEAPHRSKTASAVMGDQEAMILYLHNCASCHGTGGRGLNGNPSLINNGLSETQISQIIQNGKGKMPALPQLNEKQIQRLAKFVKNF